MKRLLSALGLLATVASAASGGSAAGAPIAWQTPTNETGNDSDVDINGTYVGAATANATSTLNGVTFYGETGFSGGVVTFSGSPSIEVSGIQTGHSTQANAPNTWSAGYQTLVSGGAYSGSGATVNIVLSGLTVGASYTVQIFEAFWNINWATSFTGGGSKSSPVNLSGSSGGAGASSVPEYLLGTFTADATSESIKLSSTTSYVIFDAIELREDGVPAPEPASLGILVVGLIGTAGLARRRRA